MGIRNGKRKDKNNKGVNIEEYARVQEIIARKEADAERQMKEQRQEFKRRIKVDTKQTKQQIIKEPENEKNAEIVKDQVDLEIEEATRIKVEDYCKRREAESAEEKRRIELLKAMDKLQEEEIEF